MFQPHARLAWSACETSQTVQDTAPCHRNSDQVCINLIHRLTSVQANFKLLCF